MATRKSTKALAAFANPILPRLPAPVLVTLHPASLRPSTTNPRQAHELELDSELVASIQQHGILEPVLARGAPPQSSAGRDWTDMELIAGHRRVAAALSLGLEAVPVLVFARGDVSDERALEMALVENLQRREQAPLEESAAYKLLRDTYSLTLEDIAAHVGSTLSHVRRRLLLCDLVPHAADLLTTGWLTVGAAEQLARVSNPDQQSQAIVEAGRCLSRGALPPAGTLAPPRPAECDPITANQARAALDYVSRDLASAPWDTADATLVPAAGACMACPKRTEAQASLFAVELEDGDLCLDSGCWALKMTAHQAVALDDARASGAVVLAPAESRQLYPHGSHLADRRVVDLDAPCEIPGQVGSWRAVARAILPELEVSAAVDQVGRVHSLVDRSDLMRRAKAAGLVKPERVAQRDGDDARRANELAAARRQMELSDAVLDAVLVQAQGSEVITGELWELLARRLLRCSGAATLRDVCRRRSRPVRGTTGKAAAVSVADLEDHFLAMMDAMTVQGRAALARALALELAAAGPAEAIATGGLELLPELTIEAHGLTPAVALAADIFGVNVDRVAARLAKDNGKKPTRKPRGRNAAKKRKRSRAKA